MNSSIRLSQPDEIMIIVEDPTPLSNTTEEIIDNSSQPEYSFQNNLIHFDYDSGLMIHQYLNGSTRYKGEWSKGCPNGNGIMYNTDGSIQFEGKWKQGEFEVDPQHHFFYKDDI